MSKNRLKIGFFGDGPWALNTLRQLTIEKDYIIDFVSLRYNTPDQNVQDFCKAHNLTLINFEKVNNNESLEKIAKFQSNIILSVSYDQIFKKELINMPSQGIINFHAGALPFYRGRNVLNWAIINGEKKLGLTVHYIDESIDTGDIILQEFIPIRQNDTYATLLIEAAEAAPKLIVTALRQIKDQSVNVVSQSSLHPIGSFFCKRGEGDEWIDWNWSSERIHNFIRGISSPGPCARTYFNDKVIKIASAEMIADAPIYLATPGEILHLNSGKIIVKTGDSFISVKEFMDLEEKPIKVKIGDRFRNHE